MHGDLRAHQGTNFDVGPSFLLLPFFDVHGSANPCEQFFSSFLPHLPGIFFHIECMVHRGVHINLQLNEGVVYTCQFFSSIVLRERSYIFKDAAFKTTSLGISARGDLATSCTKEELLMIGGAAVLCGNI